MTTVNEPTTCVESISLMDELEKRVALVTVRLGEVQIRGIAVWRSKNGKLSVFFPSYKLGSSWVDAIYVSEDLRSEIEADVIAAYKAAKAEAKKEEGKHSSQASTESSL
jgi:hypothetical protein